MDRDSKLWLSRCARPDFARELVTLCPTPEPRTHTAGVAVASLRGCLLASFALPELLSRHPFSTLSPTQICLRCNFLCCTNCSWAERFARRNRATHPGPLQRSKVASPTGANTRRARCAVSGRSVARELQAWCLTSDPCPRSFSSCGMRAWTVRRPKMPR